MTTTTGYVYDERHKLHTHSHAADSAARLGALMRGLEEMGELEPLTRLPVELGPWDWVTAAHTRSHVDAVRRLAAQGKSRISFDTYLTPAAPEAALLGASSAVCATRAVLQGEVANAFSLMRPCGHHALSTRAMGYCIFNNVAVAAHYALREHGLQRVMVVDIDAHHGNGTEEIFYGSSEVLFVSFHQHPWFPGTGDWYRNGAEAGLGYNYNIALPTRTGDAGYLQAMDELVGPLAERFQPELILVSAGFDAHWLDHSSVLGLTVGGYYRLVEALRALAEGFCQGRVVLVLEGGYNLRSLTGCTAGALRALRGAPPPEDTIGPSPDKPVASVDGALAPLKGFMRDLMRPSGSPGYYDQAVEIPYEVR
jgi:acetoin utilization deacetylase AcuC-like enzyme